MRNLFLTLFLLIGDFLLSAEKPPLKALHICFHDGCIQEIEGVAKALSLNVTSQNILKLPEFFFDPTVKGGEILYQMDKNRAVRVWGKHKEFFNKFDVIITSDTTPLCRIFLENGWKKPLVVWVSNRFDWYPTFFGKDYYNLLRDAYKNQKNVIFVFSSPFELFYAKLKNVDLGNRIIAACASNLPKEYRDPLVDPERNSKIFVHTRTQEVQSGYGDIAELLKEMEIPAHCERYGTLEELQSFKGVLYLPYQWYVISMFETIRLGLPTFVPSEKFLLQMIAEGGYKFESAELANINNLQAYSEWYNPQIREIMIYFDSWEDLKEKLKTTDLRAMRKKTWEYGKKHHDEMLRRWKIVFDEVSALKNQNKPEPI